MGFAFLRAHRPRRALRRAAEITCFILPEHMRNGIGTAVLGQSKLAAQEQGIDTLLASVSSRNGDSRRFHATHGFSECGRLRQIGEKSGEVCDAVWLQLEV